MEGLNSIFCGTDVKNTGVCDCFFDPKLITGAIFIPKAKVLTATEVLDANIQDTLEALVQQTKSSRIFPFQNFVNITDNSEDPTQQTFGYGPIETVREGNYNWLFQFRKGGLNLSNALRTFNGLTGKYNVIFIENQNTLIGTSRKDANDDWGLGGIPMEDIYTLPWKANDGTNLSQYATRFVFRPEYINELIAFKRVATTSYLLSELVGLEDIKLTIVEADEDADTVDVTATTDCGSTNLYELFADELEEASAWVVKDADGAAITVTVAKNEATEGWTITYTTGEVTDGDTITLAAPSVLAAAPINVSGYEADTVTVELGS